jgi:3-phosphoshikimate 1-carboxyvinyltransferase
MIEITVPQKIKDTEVTVPGSKSYTHRILIAAALSDGICTLHNGLKSEDTWFTLNALKKMGVKIEAINDRWLVHGTRGRLNACSDLLHLGNSGTSMRFLTAVASLGRNIYTLTGTKRMQERPIQDLIDGLSQIGVKVRALNNNGCPPVEVEGGRVKGGSVALRCKTSSQYLSALLLISPYTENGLNVRVVEGPVSKPYIDMTIEVMTRFGVEVKRSGYRQFAVSGKQIYREGTYAIEPDASQAGYFWAAAAITGAGIKVKGITRDSCQGDVRFTELLEAMGCQIIREKDGTMVRGKPLSAIETDMADMPDMVPTLAVVAAFAKGTTVIKNVTHLRAKESDRLASVVGELAKIGIDANFSDSGLVIKGGIPHGAEIDTHGDHRIAMSFSLAGLKIPGIFIQDERCVEKSFPEFWRVLRGLYPR